MSDDPTPPPSPEPASPTMPGENPVEALPQKRRQRRNDLPAAPSSDDSDNEIIVLSSLLQNLLARKQGVEPAESVETEARGKINRFVSRKDAPAAPAASPSLPAISPGRAESVVGVPVAPTAEPAAPPRPPVAGPESLSAIAFPKFEPRSYEPEPNTGWGQRTGSTWGRGVLYFAFSAGIALAAFLAGRNEGHHGDVGKTAPAALPPTWTPTFMDPLDRALTAERDGDLTVARRIADELLKSMKPNAVLDAYSATIDTRLGRLNDVEAALSRKLGPNLPPDTAAALYAAQAFNYTRRREFERASDCFREVAKVRPFDATNLLLWGEAQRRQGQLTDALDRFQQALLRLPVEAPNAAPEREYVAFKRRLSLVELGRDAEFKAELDQRLNDPAPSGYWLLTGAAVALQKKDMPTAVDLLKKAQGAVAPTQFTALMEDYFFRAFAYQPEMIAFLGASTSDESQKRQMGREYFIDP